MSLEKDVRNTLSEAPANMKKLDQLVRQGLMSPAALPMLHRGLDKLNAGKVLNPQEREAVNKVLQSMLYIVTGDDTVFQRAKQHTQKTRYQTESKEEYDNEGEMAKKQLTTLADAAQELMGMLSDNQNLPEWVQSKITKATDYLDTARDYMKSEGDDGKAPVGEEVMSESYKEKFAAALKKSGKTLAQMSDEEKKKFFNSVDASHKAKNEELEEGAMSRIDYQQKSGEKGTGLKTFKKKPAAKDTMVASPKTQRVKMTTAKAAERMVKKGAVYAEDAVEEETLNELSPATKASYVKKATSKVNSKRGQRDIDAYQGNTYTGRETPDMFHRGQKLSKHQNRLAKMNKEDAAQDSEDMRAKAERKAARTAKKVAGREKATDPGIKENRAYADARRAMRSDSKGMASLKKSGGTKTHTGTKAGEERHGGHIVMQLRKAVSIGKPVKFKDGKEHKVSKADAHKFLSKYNSSKPADREKMHSGHDSHDSFQSHINN